MISEYLKKYSYYYLSRYSVTKKKFENILKKKISKDFFQKKITKEKKTEYFIEVPDVIKYFNSIGCFNETNLVEMRLNNLLKKGYSLKKIKTYLIKDLFSEKIIDEKMNELIQNHKLNKELMEIFFHRIYKSKKNYLHTLSKTEFKKILSKLVIEGFEYEASVNFLKTKLEFYDYP